MARTELQKKARKLIDKLPYIRTVKLGTSYTSQQKCKIGNEVYVNMSCFDAIGGLERLKTYAKNHNWKQSDLFPAYISGSAYCAITYLVRISAILEDREGVKAAIVGKKDFRSFSEKMFETTMTLATAPFEGSSLWEGINKSLTEEQFANAHKVWAERIRLLKESDKPDIETCIRILKEAGYKIMKPVTQYEEI